MRSDLQISSFLASSARACARRCENSTEKKSLTTSHFPSRIAGNPADPIKEEGGESSSHGGMSAEDRRLSESVARSVMKITFEVSQWDETETVSSSSICEHFLMNKTR